ncbi:MAG: hypothetical protein EBR94_00805 [Bacteroidetes bacterium]|nr:hypothetical protein [Bacteroidota bacterium]
MTSEFLSKLDKHHKRDFLDEVETILDEESRKDFYLALDNPKISAATIVKVLSEFGIKGNITSINRLRKKR